MAVNDVKLSAAVILVIDNYDSFTYNLVQYLGQCGAQVEVRRNDTIGLAEIHKKKPSGIMLSPGPCTPDKSGICVQLLESALNGEFGMTPIIGVCLGHQAIGMVSGAIVTQAQKIMHGKTSMVRHDGLGLFAKMPNPFRATRYHSLIVREDSLPPGFVVSARSEDDNEIMGLRHSSQPIEGVQFHPESILTENGLQIIKNFVTRTQGPSFGFNESGGSRNLETYR